MRGNDNRGEDSIRIISLFIVIGTILCGVLICAAFNGCTPVSHKPSRFEYGDPYTPGPDHGLTNY